MFCPNCGSQNPDNINYCTNCGSSLNNASQYQDFGNNSYQNNTYQQSNNYQTVSIDAEGVRADEAYKFRGFARQVLNGKWGNAALLMLVFTLCSMGISFVTACIPLAFTIISPVLGFGLLSLWIKLKNGENIRFLDFFSIGFSNFGKVWAVLLRAFLKFILPILFVLIPSMVLFFITALCGDLFDSTLFVIMNSIVMLLSYIAMFIVLTPIYYKYMFVLNELVYSPNDSAKDIVERSGNFMMGKRVGAFWLQLTFIGWCLLATLGCGIPFLWVTPYMQIATIIYYEWASGRLGQGNANTTSYGNNDVNISMDYGPYNSGNN